MKGAIYYTVQQPLVLKKKPLAKADQPVMGW